MIVCSTVGTYAKAVCNLNRVNVCTQENKFPAVFFFLPLYHHLNAVIVISAACIFHTIRSNNKKCLFWAVFLTGVLVNIPNMMDSTTNRIEKGCAPTYKVFLVRHWHYS